MHDRLACDGVINEDACCFSIAANSASLRSACQKRLPRYISCDPKPEVINFE
jgi:hypothetical protein